MSNDGNIVSHTPGPWQAATAGSSVVGIPVVGPKGRAIASLHFIALPRVPEEEAARSAYNAEQLANARLIAAAPDLFKAAKRALSVLKAQGHGVAKDNVLGALVLAIDKAEGRS